MKISIVIACYNPGDRISEVVAALDAQTMPVSDFEVIYVDDGSTDRTFARLVDIAAERPNVSVETIPNSGWPGRPRNIGIDKATGEYILFMDHDDGLFPESLQRAYEFARANNSDVVLTKEIAVNGPTVSWIAFLEQIPATRTIDESILSLLTPHKFYRRTFLREHDIRFKEGRIRLEDYLFNFQVFVHDPVVSVLADYPTYRWFMHPTSNAVASFDEDVYWQVFDEIIDVVDTADIADDLRDRLYIRLYKNRVLWNLSDRLSRRTPAGRRRIYNRMFALAEKRFPPHLDGLLPAIDRPRAYLLRHGDFEHLVALSTYDARGFALRATLESAEWVDGALDVTVRARMTVDSGEPFPLRRDGARIRRALPPELEAVIPAELLDVTDDLAAAVVELSVRGRTTWVEWRVPSEADTMLVDVENGVGVDSGVGVGSGVGVSAVAFEFVVRGRIDPATAAFGQPLADDVWAPIVRLSVLGHARSGRVEAAGFGSALAQLGRRRALAYVTRANNLSVDMSDQKRLGKLPAPGAAVMEPGKGGRAKVKQAKVGQAKAAPDKTAPDKTAPDKTAQDKVPQTKAGLVVPAVVDRLRHTAMGRRVLSQARRILR